MINREARLAARAISQGESTESTTEPKVALYGLLARLMNLATLDPRLHSDTQPKNFWHLEDMLVESLGKSASQGLLALDGSTRGEILERINGSKKTGRELQEQLVFKTGLRRLEQGCMTAARAEVMTLRTIAQKQATGATVSEDAVFESARIPRSIASIHLRNLPMAVLSYARWSQSEGGDNGVVFGPHEIDWHSDKGLSFANVHEDLLPHVDNKEKEPQIGCPATLVSGYIQNIHHIASTAALESGLIEIS